MSRLIDITQWSHKPYVSTGGTRNKTYVEAPDGTLHFFKTSLSKPGKDYVYEFWSEIIAYEVGQSLGFNVLRYDAAIDGEQIGCLSQSMIDTDREVLNEGIRYLKAFDPTFNFDNKESRGRYSFQAIEQSLDMFGLQRFLPEIVAIVIFDSIIGNGDRHQENWATISTHTETAPVAPAEPPTFWKRMQQRLAQRLALSYATQLELTAETSAFHRIWNRNVKFAPIYDSGSSLARECSEEKIQALLRNKTEFDGFIHRGKAEIRWQSDKLSHFDLIARLQTTYRAEVGAILERTLNRRNVTMIDSLVSRVAQAVSAEQVGIRLSDARKELIGKLLTERPRRLETLL